MRFFFFFISLKTAKANEGPYYRLLAMPLTPTFLARAMPVVSDTVWGQKPITGRLIFIARAPRSFLINLYNIFVIILHNIRLIYLFSTFEIILYNVLLINLNNTFVIILNNILLKHLHSCDNSIQYTLS